ncbi:HPP family protein [Rickettsiales bacterium]|nr:HPP family protein [Rickettsiales bacterium]
MFSSYKSLVRRLLYRHQKKRNISTCLKAGIKGFITIGFVAAIGYLSEIPLIAAPFGATCISLYVRPSDEFSQPINIIGGYFISTMSSIILMEIFPYEWWLVALMLGTSITAMAYLRVTHPSAGSVPLLIFYLHKDAGFEFLISTILAGSIALVAFAYLLHRLSPARRSYPNRLPGESPILESKAK